MVVKKKRSSKTPALSAAQLHYLAAVEEEKSTTTRTANVNSLLKDVVKDDDKDDAFFSSVQQDQLPAIAQAKILKELNSLYEEYTFATAKDASLTDDLRREDDPTHTEDSLVYGEIDLKGFCQLLRDIASSKTGIFYDLGSGSGRAVFCARFLGDFDQCIGIELLPNLHQMASSVQSLYKFQYQHKLNSRGVQFVCSDLLDYDWSDGTVVYAPSLLFDDVMMEKIAEKSLQLQPGAYLISLKKFGDILEAFHQAFEMTQQRAVPMSWGESNVYVYRRRRDDTG